MKIVSEYSITPSGYAVDYFRDRQSIALEMTTKLTTTKYRKYEN